MMRIAASRTSGRAYNLGSATLRKKISLEEIAKSCLIRTESSSDDESRRNSSRGPRIPTSFLPPPNHPCYSLGDLRSQSASLRSGQVRHMSMSAMLPEVVQNFSIWGGTGYMLKTINMDGTVPFWASFAIISVLLRTALIPLVIYSARMSGRFAKVAPEVQFIVTLFQNDMKKMRTEGKSLYEKRNLFVQNMQTIQTIYKLHNINPLTVFLSPLMQIPFFYYVAHDLRKIVNGADPALAQELTESSFYWVPDLTDPDPWFGLPIAAGAMLYANVEVAIGKRSLSGPTAAKSDFAGLLKDGFQTLAVFMPCFVSQSPAGIQIYLVSSFTFTLFQGAALRSDTVRNALGLPAMGSAPTEPKYAKEFMEFKKMEQKARDIRGDGPVLGKNILAVGFETSFPGTNRPSTIEGSGILPPDMDMDMTPTTNAVKEKPKMDIAPNTMLGGGLFIHGISAPPEQLEAQMAEALKAEEATGGGVAKPKGSEFQDYLTDSKAEAAMEAANHGAVLAPKEEPKVLVPEKIDPEKFKKKKGVHYSKKR